MPKPQKLFPYRDNQALDKDLTQIYDWASRIEYTEINPDGSRVGRFTGEILLLKSGVNYYVEVCTQAGTTTWLGILLSNTP